MDLVTATGIGAAGVVAGAVNAIAGGGSLLTFPVLLAAGLPSVSANVTNTVGIVPGTIGGSIGYRAELRGQRRRVLRLGVPGVLGGLLGGAVLLITPTSVFDAVVPGLIAGACFLLLAQPRLTSRIQSRRPGRTTPGGDRRPALWMGVLFVGVYAGYFGAAAGVMFLALFGLLLDDSLQRANALKGVLAGVINAVAALLFAAFGPVEWAAAVALGLGTIVGGRVGAGIARRIPDRPLRLGVAFGGLVIAALLAYRAAW